MIRFVIFFLKWLWACIFTRHPQAKVEAENIMLIAEKGNDARDNGYAFFLYVKRHHPEIRAYYVITADSFDLPRLSPYSNAVVYYGSLKNCRLFWQAKYLVSTHQRAGHTPFPFVLAKHLDRVFHIYKGKKVVFLQHGITKDFIPRMTYRNTHYDLFVCGAKPEYDYLTTVYGYPESVAKYTGFCRYDNLAEGNAKRQILLMPTWRKYLYGRRFDRSLYCQTYLRLLSDPELHRLLKKNDVDLFFFPHHRVQPYVSLFEQHIASDRIMVCRQSEYSEQQLLQDSALLITDYSSVFFDFAYMRKPVVFFHFDYDEYRNCHFQPGYFDYQDSFGPIATAIPDLLRLIQHYVDDEFQMENHYRSHVDDYFLLRDTHNSERVYKAIMQC